MEEEGKGKAKVYYGMREERREKGSKREENREGIKLKMGGWGRKSS